MANALGKAKKARGKPETTNKHRKSVPAIIERLIEDADIIIEVLDSRFISHTRNPELEKKVKSLKKILIYVLNKSDLVNKSKIKTKQLEPHVFFSSKEKEGYSNLKKLIKIYQKRLNKENLNIGFVGYPNAGKSSMINYLTKKSSAKVSSEAGFTKGIKKIKFSKGVYLIDAPGIIIPKEKSSSDKDVLAKQSQIGAITLDKTKDPELVVSKIMAEYPELIEKHYNLIPTQDSEILIENLGRKLNYLKKGNIVDETKTAKKILRDWQNGIIKQI